MASVAAIKTVDISMWGRYMVLKGSMNGTKKGWREIDRFSLPGSGKR
jgi:hypothetical protein